MKKFNLTKKMLALALGVLMLLSVMTGCGKTNDQAGGGSGDTQQEQTGALLKKIKDSGKLVTQRLVYSRIALHHHIPA